MDEDSPRFAATIAVIHDGAPSAKILMVRRSVDLSASGGAVVFPGGALEHVDSEVARRGLVAGPDDARASARLGLARAGLSHYCAAARELFEEARLLLVVDASGLDVNPSASTLDRWRRELRDHEYGWVEFLQSHNFRLNLANIAYVAHWVTPRGVARRFDTRFFAVRAPRGQEPSPDGSEVVQHWWVSARDALEHHERGQWTMLVPTVHTLTWLAAMPDLAIALGDAESVVRVEPQIIERDGARVIVVPGDPGYVEE